MPEVLSYKAVGVQTALTAGSSVTTLATPRNANAILIQNIDASDDAIFTIDGTDPSTQGFYLWHSAAATPNTQPVLIPLPWGVDLKIKRAASSDVSLVYCFVNCKTRF